MSSIYCNDVTVLGIVATAPLSTSFSSRDASVIFAPKFCRSWNVALITVYIYTHLYLSSLLYTLYVPLLSFLILFSTPLLCRLLPLTTKTNLSY